MKIKILIAAFCWWSFYVGAQNTNLGTGAGNSGNYNTSLGYYAGDNVTGGFNTSVGFYSGKSLGNASYNTFVGYYSGFSTNDVFATNNVFVGSESGRNNTTGRSNTFLGHRAGHRNISGMQNTAVGSSSGGGASGGGNTFLGYMSGRDTNGSGNVMIGVMSGGEADGGNYNTFLGGYTGYYAPGSNNIFIGYRAGYYEAGSNKLYIDNSSTNVPLIYGDFSTNQVGINTLPGSFTLNIGGPINATGLYVNGQPVSFGAIPPGVSPWTINGTAINYNNGNVGLGVLSNAPAYKLDVNGSINASGFLLNGNALGQWIASAGTIYYNGGNVGIGTASTGSFKLAVEGKIAAREVQVTTANPWPDYVFSSNYKLPSLLEVEKFIKANKHLPGIPSESEIKKNGHKLGEMDILLLEKIEELTLYVIDLKKEVEQIKKENEVLKSKLKSER